MIFCRSHNFIFVKTRKVASSSLHWALEHHCGPNDIVIRRPSKSTPLPKKSKFTLIYGNGHVSYSWLTELFDGEDFSKFFSFCFVRNPWDRMVSLFWHSVGRTLYGNSQYDPRFSAIKLKFNQWLPEALKDRILTRDHRLYNISGKPIVNFIGRYEHLEDDYQEVCDNIGIEAIKLPQFLSEMRKSNRHYSAYYNKITKSLVKKVLWQEIEPFGYTFESHE